MRSILVLLLGSLLLSQHVSVFGQEQKTEDDKKKEALVGAAILGTVMATAVAVKKFDETADANGTPTVEEYITAKKVDAPATYITSINSPYCFPQTLSKVSVPAQCPQGFTLDSQTGKCFVVTGFTCPKGSSRSTSDPSQCIKCIGLKKCVKMEVSPAQPVIKYTDAVCANGFAPSASGTCGTGCPFSTSEDAKGKCVQGCPLGYSECKLGFFHVCTQDGATSWGSNSCDIAKGMLLKLDKNNVCTVAGPVLHATATSTSVSMTTKGL